MSAMMTSNWVFQGNALPESAKMPAMGGTTTVIKKPSTRLPTMAIRMG